MAYSYLPISVSVKGRSCLVVGGGVIALRKIDTLLDYDTNITVIAPEVHDKIAYYAEQGRLNLEKRPYTSPEAATFDLVISASADKEVNRQVHDDAKGGGALVNVVDTPDLCDFIFPAVVRRDALSVAVSTDSKAPFLSGHLRSILETIFPEHWTKMMQLATSFRAMVHKRWPDDFEKRTACFGAFLEADWKEILKDKDEGEVYVELERMLG